MIVLHGSICERRLMLWGEASNGESKGTKKSRSQAVYRDNAAMRYPYEASKSVLVEALKRTGATFKPVPRKFLEFTAWLPSKGTKPVPSSRLIADPPSSRAKPKIAPWTVTAYLLDMAEAVELLCVCASRRTLAPGVVVGADLALWTEALRFAGSIVRRQQYLPGIRTQEKGFRAHWEPILAGADSERLKIVSRRLPDSARALVPLDSPSPPQVPAVLALEEFVSEAVDYLARASQAEHSRPSGQQGKKTATFDSVHDAWLHALGSSDGVLYGDAGELALLSDQVRQWRRPIDLAARSPLRLCFRLEEPTETARETRKKTTDQANPWYVRYLLQPTDDPSLQIPAKDAWSLRGKAASSLQRYGPAVQEYLLASLGQAAGLCPGIASSLEGAEPAGYDLDTHGAHQFLTEMAGTLEQAGFAVMLPAWWTRKGTKERLSVRAKAASPKFQGAGTLSLDEIAQVDWEVALAGKKLTLQELEALAKLKAPLVKVRGQWVEMTAEEIRTAIDFWKKKASDQVTVRDLVQMAVGAKEGPAGFVFAGVQAKGWIGKLLKELNGKASFEELAPPESFAGTLRHYQTRGYSWLSFLRRWGLGACLADDMGLGKTVQTLALVLRDWESNGKRPVLLICPTTVVNNWLKEATKFTPELPVLVHHGAERMKGRSFKKQAKEHALVISSYGLLYRDLELFRGVPWAGIVLDEAQNVKNSQTKQAKSARALTADYRIALTGTPVENNVGDLWSIMEFLNPGFLGTQAEFKRNFFIPIQANGDPAAADRLKRITGKFVLRRLKTDKSIIADLPDKMEMKVYCPLTKEQASLYKAVLQETEEALKSAEGIQRKGLVLATLSKLKQVCNHPAQLLGDNSAVRGRSGKLARLTEMLEEIVEVGDRALVFTQFAEMGTILQKHLQETFGREMLFLHGGATRKQRDRMIDRFQNGESAAPIFILSLKAGGTGLNLTAANHVFHFDRWWNPAVENQATDRAFRIGQTKNVQVHKFICAGTLEEKIDDMIERKQELAEEVVGTGESWLTELSNKALKELLALRKEAVGD